MIKKVINFIKQNFSIQDIGLIILAALSIFMLLTNNVFAAEGEIGWSSTNRSITDSQLKEIISSNTNYDVTNDDFSTYTLVGTSATYNQYILPRLLDSNYSKLFVNYSDTEVLVGYASNKFSLTYSYNAGYGYGSYYIGCTGYIFNLEDKTIKPSSNISNATNSNFNDWLSTTADVSLEEFKSFSYQQNLIYNDFFLVVGPVYNNDNSLLNYVTSYKITGNVYENIQYSGDLVFSDTFESWQTLNLSESFYNSGDIFSYYVYAYDYSEAGVSRDSSYKVKIGDFVFDGNSAYIPKIEDVNYAIKQIEGYMNYVYTICLFLNDSPVLLRSDIFLVDAKPIVMIENFKRKYDYIYYGSYIDIGETPSGDIGGGVISPSGDDTNLEGGISGIWQAIVDLPKNLLEGLVGLFVPPSDYFFNDDPDDLGLWQRFSTFFQQKLGFLYDVLAFIPNLINIFLDIIQSFSEEWSIQIPDLTIPALTGVEEFTFFEGFEWSPYDWVNSREEFRNLYDLYLKIIDFFVYWGLIWYGIKTYNNVMGNVNYDVEGE